MNVFLCVTYILPAPANDIIVAYVSAYAYEDGLNYVPEYYLNIPIEGNDNSNQVNTKIVNAAKAAFEAGFSRPITNADEVFVRGEAFR